MPFGASHGTRVILEGAGDLVVEFVEPCERAHELFAANEDYEGKLETAWAMDRAARRRVRRAFYLALTALVAVVPLIAVGRALTKAGTGEPCRGSDSCRSGTCVRLVTMAPRDVMRIDDQRCTSSCATDLDCPDSWVCSDHEAPRVFKNQYVLDAPPGLVCVPKGY